MRDISPNAGQSYSLPGSQSYCQFLDLFSEDRLLKTFNKCCLHLLHIYKGMKMMQFFMSAKSTYLTEICSTGHKITL